MSRDATTKWLDDRLPNATWAQVKTAWREGRRDDAVAMVRKRTTLTPMVSFDAKETRGYIAMSCLAEDAFGGAGGYRTYVDGTLIVSEAKPLALHFNGKQWKRFAIPRDQWRKFLRGKLGALTLGPIKQRTVN